MGDVVPESRCVQLGVGQQVGDFVDGQEDQVAPLAFVEEFLDGEVGGEFQEQGGDDVDVFGAVLVAAPVGFVEDGIVAGDFVDPGGQGVPFAGGDDAGGDPAVLAGIGAQGDDQGGVGADAGDIPTEFAPEQGGMGVGVVGDEGFLG